MNFFGAKINELVKKSKTNSKYTASDMKESNAANMFYRWSTVLFILIIGPQKSTRHITEVGNV